MAGELEIQGYLEPRNGNTFSGDEVNAAYLLASTDCSELKEDEVAAALLQEFVQPPPRKIDGLYHQVFTFDEKVPDHVGLRQPPVQENDKRERHTVNSNVRCVCCQTADWLVPEESQSDERSQNQKVPIKEVNLGKKYKPVAQKVRPIYGELPERFRIKREITGNLLKDMPGLSPNPADFAPTGRYTLERKEIIDKIHSGDFLWAEERKLMHHFMMVQEEAFAWDDSERGSFRKISSRR